MTCIAFIRAHDSRGCVIAGDRIFIDDSGTKYVVDRPKIWRPSPNVLAGYAGSVAAGQRMQRVTKARDPKKKESSHDYLVNYLIPILFQSAQSDKEISLLVVVRGEPFLIDSDGCVMLQDRAYTAIGSGEQYANGALAFATAAGTHRTEKLDELARNVIELVAAHTITVGPLADVLYWQPKEKKRKK